MYMINNEYKFIFIHIGKTGGTSIERVFDPRIGNNVDSDFKGKHWNALKYRKKHPRKYKKYFKFTFVRNPWDREVSSYVFFSRIGLTELTFKERLKERANRIGNYFGHKDILRQTYNHMITDTHGRYLPDFIGKFENLQSDFDTICDKIGKSRVKLPHYNKTKRLHYSNYYDDETREMVANAYATEIEHFGYKFEQKSS